MSARQARPAGERPAGPIVDFVAVQADGTPVADLQSSEVEVRINGRVRNAAGAPAGGDRAAPARARRDPGLPAPFGTNDNVAAGRSFALVVDQESFVAGREQLLRNAVDGLLAELTPADQTMVVALPFGGVKVPFTSDAARVRRAMDGLSGQGPRDETGSDLACRTRRFLEALDGFLQGQAGRSSPLTVVLFTAGLAAPRRDAPMALAPGMCELLVDHFQRITVTAGAARANVYVMQPDDVGMAGDAGASRSAGVGYLGSDNPLEGIEHLAGATGGVRLPLDATGTRCPAPRGEGELGVLRGRTRARARRGLRPQPAPRRARAAPRRHGARPSGDHLCRTRRAGRTPRLTVTDLLASRDAFTDAAAARRRLHRARSGRAAARRRRGGAGRPAGVARLGGRGPDRWRRPRRGPLVRRAMRSSARSWARWWPRPEPTGCAWWRSTRPAGSARPRTSCEVGLTAVGPLSLGSLMLGLSRDDGVCAELQFGARADGHRVIRHLRRRGGHAALGGAGSGPHPGRARPRRRCRSR